MMSNRWSLDFTGALLDQATGNESSIVNPSELQAMDEKQTTGPWWLINKQSSVQSSLITLLVPVLHSAWADVSRLHMYCTCSFPLLSDLLFAGEIKTF